MDVGRPYLRGTPRRCCRSFAGNNRLNFMRTATYASDGVFATIGPTYDLYLKGTQLNGY
jgi:hypothetical protein